MSLETLAILIVLLPLASAVVAGGLGPVWLKERTHGTVIAGVGGAMVCSFLLLFQVSNPDFHT